MIKFANRAEAGRLLAERLMSRPHRDLVVLGLPRGGVPVAYEVARALDVPLDVIVVRKLGVPYQPELAMGAVGEEGVVVVNDRVLRVTGVAEADLQAAARRERAEVERRAVRFRGGHARLPLDGRTALIVDDGIATGSTVRAACAVARAHGAAEVIVATPVAPPDTVEALHDDADDVIVLSAPAQFYAVGQFYADFGQTTDDEVVRLVAQARAGVDREVEFTAGSARLEGHLSVPVGAHAVVVFAHGSGSSRHSPRNQYIAEVLQRAGLGTLLFGLLTDDEARDRSNVFDVPLLAARLRSAVAWLRTQSEGKRAAIGVFGASTGAAAALWAAAELDAGIAAVVSRGGRPDLAVARLGDVRVPTMLIVGSHDPVVLELNREAFALLHCEKDLSIVPGASHLFEEPGTLDAAANRARDWFVAHLAAGASVRR